LGVGVRGQAEEPLHTLGPERLEAGGATFGEKQAQDLTNTGRKLEWG